MEKVIKFIFNLFYFFLILILIFFLFNFVLDFIF